MTLGVWGAIVILAFGLLLGIAAQWYGEKHATNEWLITGVAAIVGAFVASEYLGAVSTYGPQFDGLAVLPALIGAVVVGGLVALVTRSTVGEPV
jgi:uncharacterized membrane protein YeaQ/YmgE (transglycosylase-associated protein family)